MQAFIFSFHVTNYSAFKCVMFSIVVTFPVSPYFASLSKGTPLPFTTSVIDHINPVHGLLHRFRATQLVIAYFTFTERP